MSEFEKLLKNKKIQMYFGEKAVPVFEPEIFGFNNKIENNTSNNSSENTLNQNKDKIHNETEELNLWNDTKQIINNLLDKEAKNLINEKLMEKF